MLTTAGGPLRLLLLLGIALTTGDAASIGVPAGEPGPKATDGCDSKIYCRGDLLHTVQLAGIFNDSKTFVDMSQLNEPNVTLANFDALMKATNRNPTREQVAKYVQDNFILQDELHNATLPDWKEHPAILDRIRNTQYREWATRLNAIWKTLARKISEDVRDHPERHSLIYVNHTFIAPGGRFREFYYWDSFWICQGLLHCDMHDTARGLIENFAQMVKNYGFVPNGGRVYYLMRSQPPLLIPMVQEYYRFTKDLDFLKKMLPILDMEFSYWRNHKTVNLKKGARTYKLAHYVVSDEAPRPESYKEDYRLAQQLPEAQRGALYNNLKAAAESGWDFSYRWCIAENSNASLGLLNVSTADILPADLNALLQQNARYLSDAYNTLGNRAKSLYYRKIAFEIQNAIEDVLWNNEKGTWCDYDMRNNKQRCSFYPSNITPLYTRSFDPKKKDYYAKRSLEYLKKQNIEAYLGGTPTSLDYTGEQWDFPNAWPPLQSFLVEGLYNTGVKEAMEFAEELASRWLSSNYIGFVDSGKMFEKYNAVVPGEGGGGGEYNVQEGFGWTNGIIYQFLQMFPDAKPQMDLVAVEESNEWDESSLSEDEYSVRLASTAEA